MARVANFLTSGQPAGPTMTLDALMRRQRELAERQAALAQPSAASSTIAGGLGQMADALFTGLAHRRAAAEGATGRRQLADIMGGVNWAAGPTAQQVADVSMLDPEQAQFMTRQLIEGARERRAREQQLTDIENQRAYQDAREERINARELGESREQWDRETRVRDYEFQRQQAAAAGRPQSPVGEIEADFAAGIIDQATRDAAIAKTTTVSRPAAADRKALWDQQDQYINTQTAINQLSRARDLLDQGINTGYSAGLRTMYGAGGGPGGDPERASRTKEYNSIMNMEAISAMSTMLKGSTTDTEMAQFIRNMNDPTLDPPTKARMIDVMLAKARSFHELQGARIRELGGETQSGPVDASGGVANEESLLQSAREAISRGADPALVKKRLVDKGIDPGKL